MAAVLNQVVLYYNSINNRHDVGAIGEQVIAIEVLSIQYQEILADNSVDIPLSVYFFDLVEYVELETSEDMTHNSPETKQSLVQRVVESLKNEIDRLKAQIVIMKSEAAQSEARFIRIEKQAEIADLKLAQTNARLTRVEERIRQQDLEIERLRKLVKSAQKIETTSAAETTEATLDLNRFNVLAQILAYPPGRLQQGVEQQKQQ